MTMDKIETLSLPSGGVIEFADPSAHWRTKHAREIKRLVWDVRTDEVNSEEALFQAVDIVLWATATSWTLPYAPNAPAPASLATYVAVRRLVGDTLTEDDGDAVTAHLSGWALDRLGVRRTESSETDKAAEVEGKGDGAGLSTE